MRKVSEQEPICRREVPPRFGKLGARDRDLNRSREMVAWSILLPSGILGVAQMRLNREIERFRVSVKQRTALVRQDN